MLSNLDIAMLGTLSDAQRIINTVKALCVD